MQIRKFSHQRMRYEFKWKKRQEVLAQMPVDLRKLVETYFNRILADRIPHSLFNNHETIRCSNFRIKGLKHGAQKCISQEMVENGLVLEFSPNTAHSLNINKNLVRLPQLAQDTYDGFVAEGYGKYKPSHDDVLSLILLRNPIALAIETPIWLHNQGKLDKFLKEAQLPSFTFQNSITGHIDLLLYDPLDQCLVIADYKPEGHFLRSLPQVASYGLMLKRIMRLERVKCVSFRKEDAWIYDPEIITIHIEKFLGEYGNPKLPWRRLLRTLQWPRDKDKQAKMDKTDKPNKSGKVEKSGK